MNWTRQKIVVVVLLLAGLGAVGTTFWAAAPRRALSPRASAKPTDAARPDDKAKPLEDAATLARNMARSRLNLRKLALAMHDYANANKYYFPPPTLINKDGKEVLSWRVLLLPYLGERELYEQFKLSEPWDSPHNKKLVSKMPAMYAPPGIKTREPYWTFYRVFVTPKPKAAAGESVVIGLQAAFVQGQSSRFPTSFPDGVSNTILIVEAGQAVPWTKPEELPYTADAPLPELGGLFPEIFHAAFASGDVHRLTRKYGEFNLRKFITSNDGQLHYYDQVMARSAPAELRSKNRELHQDLDDAQERLRLLQEERDTLKGRSRSAKSPQDADPHFDELKRDNARLQKELEKLREEMEGLNSEILQRLKEHSKKKTP